MDGIISIALGGAIGAVCRYTAGNLAVKYLGDGLPYGTFIINLVGCFCMGLLMTLIVDKGLLPPIWRLFLCVGFLGGFTTFSSFGYETLTLLTEGNILMAVCYAAGSTVLGLLAAGVGVWTANIF